MYKNGTVAAALDEYNVTVGEDDYYDCGRRMKTALIRRRKRRNETEWKPKKLEGSEINVQGSERRRCAPNQNPSRSPDVKDSQIARWARDHGRQMGDNDSF